MVSVEFFYDFVCPYAYLASLEIGALTAETGAQLTLRPTLLGGVFRSIGGPDDPNLTKGPAKAAYGATDLARAASRRGVTLRFPERHPRRTVLALRAAIASSDVGTATRALYAAYWRDGLDLEDPAVVTRVLDEAGLDGAATVARAGTDAIKAELRAQTDEAVKHGVFGVPTFRVQTADGPQLFWGVDRLHHLRAAIAGRATLPFYFDYASPFAYLAATQVPGLAARTNARVAYRPLLLGGLFKAIGTANVPLFEMPAAKRAHVLVDIQRWAAQWGVPFRFTSRFPMNTVKALRLTLATSPAAQPALVDALFRALWAEDRDISDRAELERIAEACGATEAFARIESQPIKDALFTATDEARARGVFGVPTFFVRDDMYWGQDRLADVERALLRTHTSPAKIGAAEKRE